AIVGVIFFAVFLAIGVALVLGGKEFRPTGLPRRREDYDIEPISGRARLPRRARGSGGRLLRRADTARRGELSYHRLPHSSGTHPGPGHRKEIGDARQRSYRSPPGQ